MTDRDLVGKKIKVYCILLAMTFSFSLFGYRLFQLQVHLGSEYQQRATTISRRNIVIPSQRGQILDRDMKKVLATNIDTFSISLIPGLVPNDMFDGVIELLANLTGVTEKSIFDKLPANYSRSYNAVDIINGQSLDIVIKVAEHASALPGVAWQKAPQRHYNDIESLSHIIGYIGPITVDEFKRFYNQGYAFNSFIGKTGIEKQYDYILKGTDGRRFFTVDAAGRQIANQDEILLEPQNGRNIVLTIDSRIQKLAQEALGPRMGSVVVLKPETGEILAMVSYPWYNSNSFIQHNSNSNFSEYQMDKNRPLINRAIQSAYSPASTFKIVLTAALLQESVFPIHNTVHCTGSTMFGNRLFHCHDKDGHGSLNLYEGLAQSCNIYFSTVGLNYLGIDRIAAYTRDFGYGKVSGIDLPNEVRGIVPDPQWKRETYNDIWVGGDTVNVSIGQGFLTVTPLQVANMMAHIINDGTIYRPQLLKEVRDPISGEILQTQQPEAIHVSDAFSPGVLSELRDYLRGVIEEGTAARAVTTKAVSIAGKTGTGEVGLEDRWHAWFASYGPFEDDDPRDRVIIVTMVEASNEWEWWAIRAANIIYQGIFAEQDYDEALRALNWSWLHNDVRFNRDENEN